MLNWLYGPRISRSPAGGWFEIRSLTLDPDTVRECLDRCRTLFGRSDLFVVDGEGHQTLVDASTLTELGDWELRHLMIRSELNQSVDFRINQQPGVIYQAPTLEAAGLEIAELLLRAGRPRPRWRHIGRQVAIAVPRFLVAALLVSWIWFCAADAPPASLIIAGSIVVVLVSAYGLSAETRWTPLRRSYYPGHRIRSENRATIRARRHDSQAALKQAAVTIPAGVILGALVTWLVTR